MHDSWNLGWKLNLAIRGLAKKDILLATYESERKKIAHDLIDFDYEHANSIAGGDAKALAENFRTNIGFISGVGAEYAANVLNSAGNGSGHLLQNGITPRGEARPGRNLPPAKVTRYIDDNPVDIQLDIPILGQFRVFILASDVVKSSAFLSRLSAAVLSPSSLISQLSAAAEKSYKQKPRPLRAKDAYYRPERYVSLSNLFTFGLISRCTSLDCCLLGGAPVSSLRWVGLTDIFVAAPTDKSNFELGSLPPLLSRSKWTVYLDNVPHLDTRGQQCTKKWLGGLETDEVALVSVRPDGYVGSIVKFNTMEEDAGLKAAQCLDDYYGGFLEATSTD